MRPSKPFLLVLAAIAIVVLAATMPKYFIRGGSAGDSTWNDLRQIDAAKQQWMFNQGKTHGDIPTWNELLPYINGYITNFYQTNGIVADPRGGIYFIGKVSQPTAAKRGKKTYP